MGPALEEGVFTTDVDFDSQPPEYLFQRPVQSTQWRFKFKFQYQWVESTSHPSICQQQLYIPKQRVSSEQTFTHRSQQGTKCQTVSVQFEKRFLEEVQGRCGRIDGKGVEATGVLCNCDIDCPAEHFTTGNWWS